MDRQIVYPGSIPLDTDLLNLQRATMVALGAIAQATLGSTTVVDGLACKPTVPSSLSISVGAGSLSQLNPLDALPFGSLPAITAQSIVKTGFNTTPTVFTLVPPSASGNAISYLVQASLAEFDATPIVLPYYNAANPSQPFLGAANAGTAQNTQRLQRVGLAVKPGTAATAGTQLPPAADPGWVGLFAVNVAFGQTQINVGDISTLPGAPFLPFKLPQLAPGFSRQVVFGIGSSGWTVPNGVSTVRAQIVGGGGGGGGNASFSGGGGGAGGYAQGIFAVQPGQYIPMTIGASGAGAPAGVYGTSGGTTSFGALVSAAGGQGGASANPDSHGGQGGLGSGGSLNQPGGNGTDGFPANSAAAGSGGASFFGGGGRGSSGGGVAADGRASGSGAGGGYNTPCNGGTGASGIAIVEF